MTDKPKVKLRVITHQGRILTGQGAGEYGDIILVDADMVADVMQNDPGAYELVTEVYPVESSFEVLPAETSVETFKKREIGK